MSHPRFADWEFNKNLVWKFFVKFRTKVWLNGHSMGLSELYPMFPPKKKMTNQTYLILGVYGIFIKKLSKKACSIRTKVKWNGFNVNFVLASVYQVSKYRLLEAPGFIFSLIFISF